MIKKLIKIIGSLILILILFRGLIYRFVIKYNDVGTRTEVNITNEELLKKIKTKSANKEIDIEGIINISNEITTDALNFTMKKVAANPNKSIVSKQANCIGYAKMFNSIANYLIHENNLNDQIEAKHKIGQLELLGIDLHQFFDTPFFKNHDFNIIINKETGEIIAIDPSVNDYLRIHRINIKQE